MQLPMVGARMCQPRAFVVGAILAFSTRLTATSADDTADGLVGNKGFIIFNSGHEIEPEIADIGAP